MRRNIHKNSHTIYHLLNLLNLLTVEPSCDPDTNCNGEPCNEDGTCNCGNGSTADDCSSMKYLKIYYTAKRIYGELEFFSSINKIFVDVEA